MLAKMSENQSGYILVYVTLTLAIAMIILPALLLFLGGSGRTAQLREDRMLQVYAADAGVEKAFHEILIQSDALPVNEGDPPWEGNITGDVPGTIYGFNENYVYIEVYKEGNETGEYRIVSTATDWEGINTAIECFTAVQDSWSLFDNALTQYSYDGMIELKMDVNIIGDIAMNGDIKGQGWRCHDNRSKVRDEPVIYWPDAETLVEYYQGNVGTCIAPLPGVTVYPSGANIDVAGNLTAGPLLVCGDLKFYSSVDDSSVLTLGDTIYVTGDITIPPSYEPFILDLNGQTIFCEQEISISTDCDIIGSGCIIALGDIDFGPKSGTQEGEFVFVLSVNGALTIWPTGDFYGSFAGKTDIIVRQGVEACITWVDYSTIGDGLWEPVFPTEDDVRLPAIITYTILDELPE